MKLKKGDKVIVKHTLTIVHRGKPPTDRYMKGDYGYIIDEDCDGNKWVSFHKHNGELNDGKTARTMLEVPDTYLLRVPKKSSWEDVNALAHLVV